MPEKTRAGVNRLLSLTASDSESNAMKSITQSQKKSSRTNCQDNLIIDQDPVKFFTMIPHIIDDLGLSAIAIRLYLHLKRITGENGGQCWQGLPKLAQHCKLSRPTVIKAKTELEVAQIIQIEKAIGNTDIVTIVNIWQRNAAQYPEIIKGVKDIDDPTRQNSLLPPVKILYTKNNPLRKTLKEDDDDKQLTEFINFIENNLTNSKLSPHLHAFATLLFKNYPAGRALEAAKLTIEKGGHSLAYLETVLKNWDHPKPEKPQHLTNYRGKSPANKNMPRQWPGKDGISPATGKAIGAGFGTF